MVPSNRLSSVRIRLSSRRLVPLLAIGALPLLSTIARGAPSYSITLQGGVQTSASPLQGSWHTATPGVAPTLIDEDATASPGHVGARTQLRTMWPFDIIAGVSGSAAARASTDDFLITGPPGATTVTGSMRFRGSIRLDRSGGLADNDMHMANALLGVTAATLDAEGSCWSGNLTEGADGVLLGQAPPDIDAAFSLSGSFPVGVPFAVSMNLEARGQTRGDSLVSPGVTSADAWTVGVWLGDQNGRAMELPLGYTVEAPSWGVVANQVTAVPAADGRELALTEVAPNPSSGPTSLGYSLPRAGAADVVVTDLQGRQVRRLASGPASAGRHVVVWEGRSDSGVRAAPGVYLVALRFETYTITRRLVRIQ